VLGSASLSATGSGNEWLGALILALIGAVILGGTVYLIGTFVSAHALLPLPAALVEIEEFEACFVL